MTAIDPDLAYCTCNHHHRNHQPHCTRPDSYGQPCECPSYQQDPHLLRDPDDTTI